MQGRFAFRDAAEQLYTKGVFAWLPTKELILPRTICLFARPSPGSFLEWLVCTGTIPPG